MIDNLISGARKEPNYKNVSRVIKIVRQIFNKEQVDPKSKEDKPQNQSSDSLAKALSSTDYRKMFDFFLAEIPDLALKVVGIDPIKSFKEIDEQLKLKKKGDCKLSLKKIYGGMNAK